MRLRTLAALLGVLALGVTPATSGEALFQRGVLLYEAYDPQDAVATFAKLAETEPDNAVGYWGQALALGPNINEPLTRENFENAQRDIAAAGSRMRNASPEQQALIAALATRYAGSWQDRVADDDAYRSAMASVVKQFPNDDTVAMLYAEALADGDTQMHWTSSGQPGSPLLQTMLSQIDTVLARNSQQPMANHLCIHAYDDAPDRTPAIACAKRLDAMTFDPQTEHLAHMPAHTWVETGDYAAAVASSERAFELINKLGNDPNADPAHANFYRDHDTYVGFEAAMMRGNFAQAQAWANRASSRMLAGINLQTLARFGHWNEILALHETEAAVGARALALARTGQVAQAKSALAQVPAGARQDTLAVLARVRIDEADHHIADAVSLLQTQDREQRAQFSAEYLPLFPAGEALGGLYLRAGRYADAVGAFRATLSRYPNDPRALYGLSQSLAAAGTPDPKVAEQFRAAWAGSDTSLTVKDL